MSVSPVYRQKVTEALEVHASITTKSMFGGVGIYADGLFCALLDDDKVYFKVDDTTRTDFEAKGMAAFYPFGDPTRPMNGYWKLPDDVLTDPEELGVWLDKAIAVARRAAAKKKSKRT